MTVSVSSGPQQQRLQHDLLVLVTVECSAVLTMAWASHSLVGWLVAVFLHCEHSALSCGAVVPSWAFRLWIGGRIPLFASLAIEDFRLYLSSSQMMAMKTMSIVAHWNPVIP